MIWIGINRTRRRVNTFTAYDRGLVYSKAGRPVIVLWDQVDQIYKTTFVNSMGRKKQDIWSIVDRQGERIHIGILPAIGKVAEEHVWPRL